MQATEFIKEGLEFLSLSLSCTLEEDEEEDDIG